MELLIRNMTEDDLDGVVQIHIKAFPGFFLTLLGKGFLLELYKNFILNDSSICKVAVNGNLISGFVVGSLNPDQLFRRMLYREGHLFFIHATGALIRNPAIVIKKLIFALTYRGEQPVKIVNAALLSSIGVDPESETKGIGSCLVRSFFDEAFLKGADAVYLTTDTFENDKVNSFYVKNGFRVESVFEKTRGRFMNRYIILRDEKSF